MAASFNPDLNDAISRVRMLIGDTDTATADVDDATITAYLSTLTNEYRVASQLAFDLSAKYAKKADITVDHQESKFSQIAARFEKLGERLAGQAAAANAVTPPADGSGSSGIFVGGLDDNRAAWSDCDFPASPTYP